MFHRLAWIRPVTLTGAWIAAVAAGVEIVSRQLTRTRLLRVLPAEPGWVAVLPLAALALWLTARWLWPVRPAGRPALTTATVFVALFASGLAMQLQFGARLQSDGFYYFAYLRSLAFDRDVNFMNDYRLIGLGDKPHLFEPTVTGHAHSAWTIGPAIVWAPFYGAGHLSARSLHARGRAVEVDGASYPYRQAICIAGLVYALLGIWMAIRATQHFFPPSIAVTAAALTIGGSFMLWYSLAEPTMTHAPAMASVAGFVWYWVATHGRRSLAHWIGLGALAGFMTMIRWQSAIFAVLPAWEAASMLWRAWRVRDAAVMRTVLIGGLAFTAAATLAFVPQMLAWKAIYGQYLAVSPVGPQIRWWDPHLMDVLFSSRNGLVAMSPILYVASLGLVAFAWRRPAFGVPSLVACAAMVYFNASIQDWWGSAGYGGRRFDGVIVLMVIGLAAAIDGVVGVVARRPRLVAATVFGLAAVWNLTFVAAARRGDVTTAAAMSFGDAGAAQARVLHDWVGHPFSFPANALFAARNGVSLGAYRSAGATLIPRGSHPPLRPRGHRHSRRALPARGLVSVRARRRHLISVGVAARGRDRALELPGRSRPADSPAWLSRRRGESADRRHRHGATAIRTATGGHRMADARHRDHAHGVAHGRQPRVSDLLEHGAARRWPRHP